MFWGVRLGSIALAVGGAFLIEQFALNQSFFAPRIFALAALYVTLAVSLNLINGITGQFSIGHAAFYQVGAYAAGFFTVRFFEGQPLQGPVWLVAMILAGAAMASLAGVLVGLPSLRLRGDYLAIVTLGFGEIIRIVVQGIPALGGAYGMNVQPKFQFIWLPWLLAFLAIAVCRNLLKSPHGLAFLSVREDEIAAMSMGVNVTRVKVTAFVLGSAFAGAAGALLAHYEGFITPSMFTMELSFIILTMVVLGGSGSITGSVLAALVLFLLPEQLRNAPPISGAALAAGTVAIIFWVVATKRVADHVHGDSRRKSTFYLGVVGASVVGFLVLQAMFSAVPALRSATYESDKLRMVIFAGTLIVIMLLRPQGILAHRELSWGTLKGWFGRQSEVRA